MKRALLIAGGTVSGLGAVLAITPPELSTTNNAGSIGLAGGSTVPAATTAASSPAATKAATATKSPTPATTKSATATKSAQATATATATKTASPTPTATATKATTTGVSGTFNGDAFSAGRYGTLTTKVTFTNGKITSVSASQSPSSWSQQSLSALIPYVSSAKITVEQIKQYSADSLPCALANSCQSRASYTASAFWSSIKSAIAKANA
jgi:hypothetical protein